MFDAMTDAVTQDMSKILQTKAMDVSGERLRNIEAALHATAQQLRVQWSAASDQVARNDFTVVHDGINAACEIVAHISSMP
ncbi:HrpD6 family protein [Xanthomonas euvesicatoria pv. eucalypti]|uniref:HrpD6 family protein n=1 Tax=Xanthomonas TaxID=338 RepID=UPI0026E4016F|nr:HrpD6 family protein [Xanthomonas euvesicatoria]MDO7932346.1 HrpD6 family protein [Xanthomonas euvesicatoria pv. eucalypti]MDO7936905.1 HrpD6 family protein [Xanthomonas euvesicatoria pv. eucalypti]MDO7940714.1 HrpD6 family protein [Xanthomonas euvesicatoria pv. eucalypti]MDO7945246.1 HrpD6 family protein [Xanthomonas euvesicatoria pv. eucalypti]MDO7948102.1 HrpD6 family protein [Xanthomonas euvesicatoria pv. eucalypti]